MEEVPRYRASVQSRFSVSPPDRQTRAMDCPVHALTSLLADMLADTYLDGSQPFDPPEEHDDTDASESELDIEQLKDITRSMVDFNYRPETDFLVTEELNMKVEVFQALLFFLEPNTIARLQHVVPDVYYGGCHGDRVFTFAVTDPDAERTVPTLCMFRWYSMLLREHLLNTTLLSAVPCDTIACFQIDELLKRLIKTNRLEDDLPCDCHGTSDQYDYEDEDCKEKIHFGIRDTITEKYVPIFSDLWFGHHSTADYLDTCHCDLCLRRRAEDNGLLAQGCDEHDLEVIWEAFFGMQSFLESNAFSADLSPLIYIEQRLCRITHYKLMQWFYENDLHTHSDLYDCPCVDNSR